MTSQKQIEANRKNAKKAGVKNPEGKEISKFNALKHGLLSKEVVITTGDGAENHQEFDTVLTGLNDHYKPVGSIEEMLVEKIAVSYWRMIRAIRYEVGLIRKQLDTYKSSLIQENIINFFDKPIGIEKPEISKAEIEEIESENKEIKPLLKSLEKMINEEKELTDLYADKWELGWHYLALYFDNLLELNDDWGGMKPKEIHHLLIESGRNIDITGFEWRLRTQFEKNEKEVLNIKKKMRESEFLLEREPLVKGLLYPNELNNLLRYEVTIDRQFYKALSELERIQRMRGGDIVPPPINLDISGN